MSETVPLTLTTEQINALPHAMLINHEDISLLIFTEGFIVEHIRETRQVRFRSTRVEPAVASKYIFRLQDQGDHSFYITPVSPCDDLLFPEAVFNSAIPLTPAGAEQIISTEDRAFELFEAKQVQCWGE